MTPASTIVNMTGDRIALGPLRRDLIETYQRWVNNFGTDRTQGDIPGPRTLERASAWYDRVVTHDTSAWFTIYEVTGNCLTPIGMTWLSDIDFRHRTASFGISIGEESSRGKGYGAETTRLVLDYAFTVLNLYNVMLDVYEPNLAGKRAYEKAGFREFGRRTGSYWMGGRRYDTILMECLATEFLSAEQGRGTRHQSTSHSVLGTRT